MIVNFPRYGFRPDSARMPSIVMIFHLMAVCKGRLARADAGFLEEIHPLADRAPPQPASAAVPGQGCLAMHRRRRRLGLQSTGEAALCTWQSTASRL